MTLSSVRPRDIVLVDGSYATVQEKQRGKLLVQWLKTTNARWVKANEIEGHWRRAK